MSLYFKPNHIGYLVHDINESISAFKKLGYDIVEYNSNTDYIISDSIQKVKICFLKLDNIVLELVQADGDNSTISKLSKKSSHSMPYHLCYEVNDLDETIKEKRRDGYIIIQKPTPAIAFNNRKIAFLFNINTGIIELLEKENFITKETY